MIRVELKVTPQQAADLIRGVQRAILTTCEVPEEAREPQTIEACGRYGKPLYAEELELLTELRHAPRTEPETPAEGQIGMDELLEETEEEE